MAMSKDDTTSNDSSLEITERQLMLDILNETLLNMKDKTIPRAHIIIILEERLNMLENDY
ncbi:hypothetical protein [Parvularcula marina]|uniref:Uncharacterized protein n=1 Tax=Parvularcula marina TaxID=2292771 RepID=A0A371RGD8_9PROT|nr:hypothetical protein [Parvularcula marina]RFB04537.1 hypothetical protein DX908_04120 [Parvularcula marina]